MLALRLRVQCGLGLGYSNATKKKDRKLLILESPEVSPSGFGVDGIAASLGFVLLWIPK